VATESACPLAARDRFVFRQRRRNRTYKREHVRIGNKDPMRFLDLRLVSCYTLRQLSSIYDYRNYCPVFRTRGTRDESCFFFRGARRRRDGIFQMERVSFVVKCSLKSPSRALYLACVRTRPRRSHCHSVFYPSQGNN